MAKFLVEFYSDSLRRSTTFQVLIPNDIPAGASRRKIVSSIQNASAQAYARRRLIMFSLQTGCRISGNGC